LVDAIRIYNLNKDKTISESKSSEGSKNTKTSEDFLFWLVLHSSW